MSNLENGMFLRSFFYLIHTRHREQREELNGTLSYLDTDFRDFVSRWNILDREILHRKVTEYSCFLIDEVCMRRVIALIVGFPVDSWETSEHTFFCHGFNIAIDGGSSDLGLLNSHLLVDIIRREVATLTGITDDFSVLVFAHDG